MIGRELKPLSHSESWDLIPWAVNGRLTSQERSRVDLHVQSCPPCREEFEAQRLIHAGVASDTSIECVPSASLQRLWERIDAEGAAPARSAEDAVEPETSRSRLKSGGSRRRGTAPHAWGTSQWVRWLAAALALESAAIAALIFSVGVPIARQSPEAPYRTVSSPASASDHPSIRAVFSPAMTLSELQAILQRAQLHIIAGPTEAGVYSLAPIGSGEKSTSATAAALAVLRASNDVRFAESVRP